MEEVKTVGIIKELWPILAAIAAGVIFMIRQEGRTNLHERELDRLQKQRDDDQIMSQRSRDETHKMLHDMSDKLDRLLEKMIK